MADESKRYDLTELIALMKANGITHLKMGGMEVDMHESAFSTAPSKTEIPEADFKMPSQEELLYAAGLQWQVAASEVKDE